MWRCLSVIGRRRRPRALAPWALPTFALVLATGLAACDRDEATPQTPPPEVIAQVVQATSVPIVVELPGRLQAVRTAEVRARVDGIVERRLYEEGTDVREGQTLFQIDPRPLKARLAAAQAALRRAEAEAANARQDVERFRPLVARNAISQQEFDAAQARLARAEADVESAQAQVEQARLDLGYATVTAPISGRAGRAQVTEGALVSAAGGTLLTTIEQLDPIYVNFSHSSSQVLNIRKDVESGRLKAPSLDQMRVTVVLEDGTVYAKAGRLNFLDLAVDPGTGTVSLRAVLPNEERLLLPGEFVRARIEVGVNPAGITVPQKAVQFSAESASVLVVGENNIVAQRPVKLGELVGDSWIIAQGLRPGERVIVEGQLKARPGAPVQVAAASRQAGQSAGPGQQGGAGKPPDQR